MLKPVPKLQDIVAQLATKHDLELTRTGAYLRLQLEGHGHLVLENIGAGRVSVTNYIPVGNDLLADPGVVLFTGYRTGETPAPVWVPMEIVEVFGGWRLYAELDWQGNLLLHDPVGQAELAAFCEGTLAVHLARHGWLDAAQRANQRHPLWTPEDILARDIRFDETASIGQEEG